MTTNNQSYSYTVKNPKVTKEYSVKIKNSGCVSSFTEKQKDSMKHYIMGLVNDDIDFEFVEQSFPRFA
jgi:hypothetical protein